MKVITGDLDVLLSFEEICRAVNAESMFVTQLIDYHVIEPKGTLQQFDAYALKRAQLARNFYYDLEVNVAGIAILLDLLDRVATLEKEIEKQRDISEDFLCDP